MKTTFKIALIVFSLAFLCSQISTAQIKRTVVSQDGKGDFKSIQAALSSLSDSAVEPRHIYIKKGTYHEKVYIEKHNIILEGEDKDGVIITAAIARDEWRCAHLDDWGVATLNIDGNDITLRNLTVTNSYGFDTKEDKTIYCPTDTSSQQKTIKRGGHQMAVRTMSATRFKAINCNFRSYAGDTMSPWNVKSGMFYFKDCTMEGGVDFYCPRGWAYAENCKFIATRGDAAIWHDGSQVEDSKTVLNNCLFEGYDGFQLGRYHRDAQFYLLNCSFAQNMADKAIYQVATKNIIKWGHRVYYYNCHKKGGDYSWFSDNISTESLSINPSGINANWVFGNKWNPVKIN
jgi:pectinesterase